MDKNGEKDGETEPSTKKESIGTGKESKVKAAVAGELKKRDSESRSHGFDNYLQCLMEYWKDRTHKIEMVCGTFAGRKLTVTCPPLAPAGTMVCVQLCRPYLYISY